MHLKHARLAIPPRSQRSRSPGVDQAVEDFRRSGECIFRIEDAGFTNSAGEERELARPTAAILATHRTAGTTLSCK